MRVIEKYNGTRTYMFPNGAIATPEIIESQYPAIITFTHIIETDENHEVCFAIQNLSAMRSMYNIDPALSEEEAIAEIQVIVNTEPEIIDDGQNSPEERIAAALEFSNMLQMPDINMDDPEEE